MVLKILLITGMKNKKILILHSSNDLYGASKIFLQIIQILSNKGFEIHVILPYNGPLDNFINKDIKVNYHTLGVFRKKYLNLFGLLNRVINNIKAIDFLSNYIKSNSIDLVYTNTSTIICGGISAKKNNIPSLFHIHEIPIGNKLYELFSGMLINKYSDKIIAVSNSVKSHWNKYIDHKKIERIYNGIIYSKTNNLEQIIKQEGDFVITSVSRIIPYKGHAYLIDIAKELTKYSNRFKFLIIGDTLPNYVSYEMSLKQSVIDLKLNDRFSFLGFRNDVSNILKQSNLFIHTAISPDPLPTVLFESLYNDVPTVATNVGGAIEILDNGNNGLLIPYNDSIKAASLIFDYSNNVKLQTKHLRNSKNHFQINFNSNLFETNILKELKKIF